MSEAPDIQQKQESYRASVEAATQQLAQVIREANEMMASSLKAAGAEPGQLPTFDGPITDAPFEAGRDTATSEIVETVFSKAKQVLEAAAHDFLQPSEVVSDSQTGAANIPPPAMQMPNVFPSPPDSGHPHVPAPAGPPVEMNDLMSQQQQWMDLAIQQMVSSNDSSND